jgi:hypothetical protein
MLKKTIFFLALLCALSPNIFSQDCKKFTPVVMMHYLLDGQPGIKTGFEAGYIGQGSKFGYTAGFQLEFHEAGKTGGEDVANETGNLFKMFVKGSYRIYRKENKRMIFITAAPELNMNAAMDFKTGIRFMFPVSPKFGFGIEPHTSLVNGNIGANMQLFCRL